MACEFLWHGGCIDSVGWGDIELPLFSFRQIITTITVDEFAPGAKSIFSFTIPDHNSGKVNVSHNA
jgi:hypothetical protein